MLNFNTQQHYEIYTCIKTLHNTLQICIIRCRHVTVQLHMLAREDIRCLPSLLSAYSLEAGSLITIWGQANWPVHWEPQYWGYRAHRHVPLHGRWGFNPRVSCLHSTEP